MSTEELKKLAHDLKAGTLATRILTMQLRRLNLITRIDLAIQSGNFPPEKIAKLEAAKEALR